ncbi:MAG: phosphotransferase [Actinomycetia bacterium]|nr:phosphotransferase [Actinomycetes bacterium]MCP4226400.1 phosphotransferase [Actinomycetes bacterium]MCP5033473.1 phosphotransferase [Actinomycetes bacterium]
MRDPDDPIANELLGKAFGAEPGSVENTTPFEILSIIDANRGRGVFSQILRVALRWPPGSRPDRPSSVVIKVPAAGPNGEAGRRIGAYHREALAYRRFLPDSPIQSPKAHLVETDDGGGASFVLEDLGQHRVVDQLDGLSIDDATQVTIHLARFHRYWAKSPHLAGAGVRANTPTTLTPEALEAGLDALQTRWQSELDSPQIRAFQRLVANRAETVAAFANTSDDGPTLCHGDPRADNLVFDAEGTPVMFDWQQIATQFGEADLAWLAATSITTDERREADHDLVAAYGTTIDRYRLGFVLPGLTVLLLAQRQANDERSWRFIATSLQRIGSALDDLAF